MERGSPQRVTHSSALPGPSSLSTPTTLPSRKTGTSALLDPTLRRPLPWRLSVLSLTTVQPRSSCFSPVPTAKRKPQAQGDVGPVLQPFINAPSFNKRNFATPTRKQLPVSLQNDLALRLEEKDLPLSIRHQVGAIVHCDLFPWSLRSEETQKQHKMKIEELISGWIQTSDGFFSCTTSASV